MGMPKLRPYRRGHQSSGSLPSMRPSTKLFWSPRRKLLIQRKFCASCHKQGDAYLKAKRFALYYLLKIFPFTKYLLLCEWEFFWIGLPFFYNERFSRIWYLHEWNVYMKKAAAAALYPWCRRAESNCQRIITIDLLCHLTTSAYALPSYHI